MHAWKPSAREPGDPLVGRRGVFAPAVRIGKAVGHTLMMYDRGKSDLPIVPMKSPNKAALAAAEAMEGRGGAKGTAAQQSTRRTLGRESVSQAPACVRRAANSGLPSNTQGGSRVR